MCVLTVLAVSGKMRRRGRGWLATAILAARERVVGHGHLGGEGEGGWPRISFRGGRARKGWLATGRLDI